MSQVIKGVTLNTQINTANPVARANIDTIIDFMSVYLKDKERWLGLSAQGLATDKWIVCRLLPRFADMGRHAGRA